MTLFKPRSTGELKTLSFSPSENTFLYSAEAKDPREDEKTSLETDSYARFCYMPTFGEDSPGRNVQRSMCFAGTLPIVDLKNHPLRYYPSLSLRHTLFFLAKQFLLLIIAYSPQVTST